MQSFGHAVEISSFSIMDYEQGKKKTDIDLRIKGNQNKASADAFMKFVLKEKGKS